MPADETKHQLFVRLSTAVPADQMQLNGRKKFVHWLLNRLQFRADNYKTPAQTASPVRCTQLSLMRPVLLILTLQAFGFLHAQETSFNVSRQDTIELNRLYFKKTVALRLDEAVILLDYQPFLKKLQDEKAWLKKEVRARERMIKKGKNYPGITSSQLKFLQERLSGSDSIYKALSFQMLDTVWIDYSLIEKAHSSVSDLVSSSLETRQCMVLSSDHELQTYLIKQTGSKKTGEKTGLGLSYYFIKGAKRHFWTKMNWVS